MTKNFDHSTYKWVATIDYRENPEAYYIGRGEQGVLICEPYKSEILPFWKFKTPEIAQQSSEKITELFHAYLKQEDFVGADMARKFLQMGFTRSRRYANYKGGRKYRNEEGETFVKGSGDPQKNASATIFYEAWQKAEDNLQYQKLKKEWKIKEGENMKANSLKKGDSVSWESPQGSIQGQIIKKITKNETVKVGDNKNRKVKASAVDPKIIVKSSKTGKQAVHTPRSIRKDE